MMMTTGLCLGKHLHFERDHTVLLVSWTIEEMKPAIITTHECWPHGMLGEMFTTQVLMVYRRK